MEEEEEEEEDYHLGKRGNPCPSSSSTSLLSLGKKVVIAGAAITSAPVVLPPLLLFSALGIAFAFPFGVYFASFFYTEKLMRSLLPSPQDIIGISIDSDQEEENNDLEMVEEEELMEVEGEGETKGKQVAGEEVGIEMWPPISSGVGEEEDKQGETEERMEAIGEEVAIRETEEEEKLMLVEGKGERNERKEVVQSSIKDVQVGGEFVRLQDEKAKLFDPVPSEESEEGEQEEIIGVGVQVEVGEEVDERRMERQEYEEKGKEDDHGRAVCVDERFGPTGGYPVADPEGRMIHFEAAEESKWMRPDLEAVETQGRQGQEAKLMRGAEDLVDTDGRVVLSLPMVEEEELIEAEGEARGEQEEGKEVGIEMWPPTVDERIVSMGDRIVPSISSGVGEGEDKQGETEERMGATREEEEKVMLVEGKGGRNEVKEDENEMLPPNIVMPSAPNAQLEENAIEPKTDHKSSIKDVEVGGEFVRLQDEEIIGEVGVEGGMRMEVIDVVSSRGCQNVGNVVIEAEVQPMERSEMEEKEEKDRNDKDIFVTETMEEEVEKQNQGIEFSQRNNLECKTAVEQSIIEQNSYGKRIETVVLKDRGRPDAEELATICNSFVPAVTSSGSTNEIEPFRVSSDYASAIEDQLSEMTDAESGNIAVVETVLYSDNEGLDSEEMIWKQIYALRTIVGYTASPPSSLGDELRALYLFTGVEPPVSLKNTSDLEEVSDKLRFLKAVIGVK